MATGRANSALLTGTVGVAETGGITASARGGPVLTTGGSFVSNKCRRYAVLSGVETTYDLVAVCWAVTVAGSQVFPIRIRTVACGLISGNPLHCDGSTSSVYPYLP